MLKTMPFMRLTFFCALALLLAGCGTARNLWDKTSDLYDTYVDPKPTLNLQRGDGVSGKEKQLAMQFSVVDQQVELLLRTLNPQDTFPSPGWFKETSDRFPWLTGIMAVDTHGEMLAQYPETPLKAVHAAPLLDREWSIVERAVQGFVQDTPLGPELIIAGPFFRDGQWQGLLVIHFDPRSLIDFSQDPDSLVLLAPGTLLWSGPDESISREIVNAPWDDILKNKVQGRWSSEKNHVFAWISRPIGALQLIYAVVAQ